MPFMHEIGGGQAEGPEPGGHRNHQPHMGERDAMERLLVMLFLPAAGQIVFLVALKIGRAHGRPDEIAPGAVLHHPVAPFSGSEKAAGLKQVRHALQPLITTHGRQGSAARAEPSRATRW